MDNLLFEAWSAEFDGGHDRSAEAEGSEDTDTAAVHWSEIYCNWSAGAAVFYVIVTGGKGSCVLL